MTRIPIRNKSLMKQWPNGYRTLSPEKSWHLLLMKQYWCSMMNNSITCYYLNKSRVIFIKLLCSNHHCSSPIWSNLNNTDGLRQRSSVEYWWVCKLVTELQRYFIFHNLHRLFLQTLFTGQMVRVVNFCWAGSAACTMSACECFLIHSISILRPYLVSKLQSKLQHEAAVQFYLKVLSYFLIHPSSTTNLSLQVFST